VYACAIAVMGGLYHLDWELGGGCRIPRTSSARAVLRVQGTSEVAIAGLRDY
jgi:hypothetical protein